MMGSAMSVGLLCFIGSVKTGAVDTEDRYFVSKMLYLDQESLRHFLPIF